MFNPLKPSCYHMHRQV